MLSFVDANGRRGEITEEFSTRYEGEWKEDVETYIEDLEREVRGGERTEKRRAVERAILDLPERTQVIEIERRRRVDR